MVTTALRYIKGIGPKRAEAFARLGIENTGQLLNYFPFRYEDRRNISKIADIRGDEPVLVQGSVVAVKLKKIPYFRARRVKSIFEIVVSDGSATAGAGRNARAF